jgi:hypothetical protein
VELPTTLTVDGTPVELRRATAADLPALVALLADDPLGAARETADGDLAPYRRAFDLLDADPAHVLVAAVDGDALVQLTTDKSRADAHRFYAGLGFIASHEGMKLQLPGSS